MVFRLTQPNEHALTRGDNPWEEGEAAIPTSYIGISP